MKFVTGNISIPFNQPYYPATSRLNILNSIKGLYAVNISLWGCCLLRSNSEVPTPYLPSILATIHHYVLFPHHPAIPHHLRSVIHLYPISIAIPVPIPSPCLLTPFSPFNVPLHSFCDPHPPLPPPPIPPNLRLPSPPSHPSKPQFYPQLHQ